MPYWRYWIYFTALSITLAVLTACATPSATFDRAASERGFVKSVAQGTDFQHAIYRRADIANVSDILHVYLGGDGSPWVGNQPAKDPTPRNPLALRLMALDDDPAIYVGRPCYHGLNSEPHCQAKLWTSARYSNTVIDSMTNVVKDYVRENKFQYVILIGYSGGGTIATLLAGKMNEVSSVVTIAANLDIDAWAQYHNFEPLIDSLNPARQHSLDDSVHQTHLSGDEDQTVPPSTTDQFFNNNKTALRKAYPGFDHQCCWESEWTSILSELTVNGRTEN